MKHAVDMETFLAKSDEELWGNAPATLVLGAGGTRRRAILEGVPSAQYASWTHGDMISCFELVFRHGIRHLIAPLLIEGSQAEITPGYREKLIDWVEWGLGSSHAARIFAENHWRVRLIGTECWPELTELSKDLELNTSQRNGPTIWFSVTSNPELHWEYVLRTVAEHRAYTREHAIRVVYGEGIPPATLYLGTGKPDVVASAVPPLLIGNMACYWRQHLGYDLDQETLRRILFDYAYTRKTWEMDKSGRAEQALQYRSAWDVPPVIGLGFRMGPFWYPAPLSMPPGVVEEHDTWTLEQ